MVKGQVAARANVLCEQGQRIMVASDLMHRFGDRLARFQIDRILLLAATIDNVAQMQHEFARRAVDLGGGAGPLLGRLRLIR
jgi:hypothetical protein